MSIPAAGPRRASLWLSSLWVGLIAVSSGVATADQPRTAAALPDAVIEEWHQHWTLSADGSTVYHERKRVKLNNDRAYGEFADPRITYDRDTEVVEVIVAQVRTAAGKIVETPAYSRNEVAPSGPAGWPAFASLRQLVLTLSGIEPGCVTEVEYRISSKPERRECLAADLRLDQRYPVTLRTVRVDVPVDAALSPMVSGLPETAYSYAATSGSNAGRGTLSHRWEFIGLAAAIDEPQSPPWQVRSPRLCFTTSDPEEWVGQTLERLQDAAEPDAAARKVAAQWTADAVSDEGRLRAIQRRLADTFNFVDFDAAWRPAHLRPVADVFNSGYGLPEEALAVLLTLPGSECRAGMLVADDVWCAAAPQASFVSAYVAVVLSAAGTQVWHPQHGRIDRDSRWAGHTLYCRLGADDEVTTVPLPAFTSAIESGLRITARIKLAADGSYTGSAAFALSGLFMPSGVDGDDGRQRERVAALLGQVLPKVRVDSLRVSSLSPSALAFSAATLSWTGGAFAGEATISSHAPLDKSAERFTLALGADGPHTLSVSWPPLARTRRETPVRLAGPFEERIELTIEWPDGWKLDSQPVDAVAAEGDWGLVHQRVYVDGAKLTLHRSVTIAAAELSPTTFAAVRDVLNQIRSESGRTLLLKP